MDKEKIETLNAAVLQMRGNMGKYVQLGSHPKFIEVQEQLKLHDYKACTSLICAHPVQLLESGFYDKHRSLCTKCEKKPAAVSAAAEQQKHDARAVVDATVTTAPSMHTETEAINNCLVPLHAAAGIKCLVNFEFRNADTMAWRGSWTDTPGVYLGQQVKSDGLYKECKEGGKVRKPNNSDYGDGGGRASFAHCKGYEIMAMIFVKSRFVDATSDERKR
ncbi:hypothetical protein N9S81_00070 [bacterium]|nr:hypothetical protein [bacterium]